MIDAKDLRICNLVYDRGGRVIKIDYFDKHKVYMEMFVNEIHVHPLTEYFTRIQPIPLTEEKLLKCGFEKISDSMDFRHPKMNPTIKFRLEGGLIRVLCKGVELAILYNLHELQNLIHSLTHEELIINRI